MRTQKGFTMIEMMVVVGIVAFLALVSVPSFMRFLAKAKRSEAYMNLHAIYVAQKAYWVEHGRYSDVLFGEGGIGWKPEGYQGGGAQESFYYSYGFGHGSAGRNYFIGKLNAQPAQLIAGKATDNEFVVVAAGDIDGNGKPDIITIDQNNKITIVQDDLAS